ncbi:MAG TPA: DoxX family protein [Candidatus Binatia bacterium]|jgi:putative oxidoreductase
MSLVHKLFYDLPGRVGSALSWVPLLLARVAVGWTFMNTGWGKLHDLDKVIGFFQELGIPHPEIQAPFVASIELVCGTLLFVGLFSRIAALPLVGTMVVAIATAQWENVDSAASLFGLVEFLYIVIFLWIAGSGPGPIALDPFVEKLLRRSDESAVSSVRSFA